MPVITIKKIAELAGVSRGTVDRVVNNRGGVNRGVRQRIEAIIKQHGYTPNKMARALVNRRRQNTIGVISATVENVFFTDVVAGVRKAESEVADAGVALLYREVAKFSVPDQIQCIDEMLAAGIDGLAINPINDVRIRDALNIVAAAGIPIITFNTDIESVDRLAYIGCDYCRTGHIAAGLVAMASGGKGRVAIVTGSQKSLGHCERVDGFAAELANFPHLAIASTVETFDDEITAYAAVRELLERDSDINAFFFAAGGKEGGIRAIRELRSVRMPHIVTVDRDAFTEQCLANGVVAATVCQQPFVQGYEPVRQLAAYLTHGERPAEAVQYTRAEIFIRQSLF